uniref:Uncharacterized protein n=1 Tax=Pseudo-nitzschia multiseries DNA virus TaxID=2364897 RepID=A0A678W378_9VIRU|nr:conserved hypothetical protein [Pseudo-nitzschia multiseries DNA virus]
MTDTMKTGAQRQWRNELMEKDDVAFPSVGPVSSQAAGREAEINGLMSDLGAKDWMRVGSTITCDPPATGTDIDVLVLVKKRNASTLEGLGFDFENGRAHYEPSEGEFNSWRRGDLNLIVTDDLGFFNAFALATEVAKTLNLLRKEDRVTLFQAILYRRHHAPQAARNASEDTERACGFGCH